MKNRIIYILGLAFLIGCKGDDTDVDGTEAVNLTSVAVEYVRVNEIFSNVSSTVEDSVVDSESNTSTSSQKPLVSILEYPIITVVPFDLITFPKQITVDFGTEGVLGPDLVIRKGIMNIVSDDWFYKNGSKHTTTFTDYYHNSNKVEGTHIAINKGQNTDGDYQVAIQIMDGKITFEDASNVTFNQNTTRTLIAGGDTPFNIWDNEYLVSGTQNGVSSKGVSYSASTEQDLHIKVSPRSILDGVLKLMIDDFEALTLDYENSTITYEGQIYSF